MPLPARLPLLIGFLALASCDKGGAKGGDASGKKPADYAARVEEGKSYVGAMARGAVQAYERETMADEVLVEDSATPTTSHALCKEAPAVPAEIPKGKKYKPVTEPGKDFETGDAKSGWKCLKFAVTNELSFQLQYRQGSGYKGPARGGPDPGPKGFEVSAEADLDGDGKKTTLITLTGVVDEATNVVKLETKPFVSEE